MKLKTWRETVAKLSQAELAERMQCDQSLISHIERGRVPSVEMARKYIAVSDGQITLNDFPHILEKYRDFLTA